MNSRALLAAAIIGLCAPFTTHAQPAQRTPASPDAGSPESAPPALDVRGVVTVPQPGRPMINIDFPGGTAMDYYRAIQQGWPGAALMLDADLARIPMPPVRLREIDPFTAARMPSDLLPGVDCIRSFVGDPNSEANQAREKEGAFIAAIRVNPAHVKTWRTAQSGAQRDLEFPGGTVAQYLDAVRRTFGGGVNVYLDPRAADIAVPPLRLSAVSPQDAVQALRFVGVSDGNPLLQVNYEGQIQGVLLHHPPGAAPAARVITRVWSVTRIIRMGTRIEDVLSCVENVLAASEAKATIKYHRETDVLFARGTPDQLELIDETLDQLVRSAEVRSKKPDADAHPTPPATAQPASPAGSSPAPAPR